MTGFELPVCQVLNSEIIFDLKGLVLTISQNARALPDRDPILKVPEKTAAQAAIHVL